MQVAILGPLEVRDDAGRPADVAGARLRSLLVRLALDAGRPVGAGTLVDAVWGDQPPADAANALQTLVSRLRRALGDGGRVQQSAAGYRLVIDRDDVDAHRFERLATEGAASLRAGAPQAAARELREALELWRGPALDGAGEANAAAALRLDGLRLSALLDRTQADLELGCPTAVVAELEALATEHPLDERLAGLLVTALAATGRQAEALASYEQVRSRLADELGVDPSAELQAVQLAVLRGEVVAAPAGPRPRTNLRAQLTSFVGRDAEVARIGKLLDEYRLVTLVGPGGAGKTRLAGEAVSRVVDSVPDGAWLVELASVSDAADVPQTVLGSLGLREAHLLDRPQRLTARDATSRLLEALADKQAIVILDNCEHLIEAAARLADTLLAQCPLLRILATSREPLGIFGESLLVVAPLGQPPPDATAADALGFPAVRLFADRAAAVRRGFAVDDDTVATVIEIVRRLDGLPLAIELAAARLRTLPLGEIADRLSDRFRLLTGGSRTALPRHRTLRAVVEWSWDLLSDPERLLAERFAVFPSGATAEAVAAVCARDGLPVDDVKDLLASLVDKSLLQPVDGGARVRMLETIREYGTERVAERGELHALRTRHAHYFAELMSAAEPHLLRREQLDWLALVCAEQDNVLAALRFWCDIADADAALHLVVSLSGMAMLLGNHADVAAWLAEALAVPGGTDVQLRTIAEGLYAVNAAGSDVSTGLDEAARSMERIRRLVDRLEDVDMATHPIAALIKPAIAMFSGDEHRMADWVGEALHSPDPWIAAAVRMFRANVAENGGDVAQMREDAAVALDAFRALGERWGLASTLRTQAMVCTLDGDLDGAEAAYAEAIAVMHELGSREDEAVLRMRMADLAARRGDLQRARTLVQEATGSAEVTGSALEAVLALSMSAEIARWAGDLAHARRLHEQARRRYETISPQHPIHGHVTALLNAVAVALDVSDGRPAAALTHARAAHEAALATKDQPIVALCGTATGLVALELGHPVDAAQILGACAVVRGSDDPTDLAIVELTRRLHAVLGARAFEAAYATGAAMGRAAALVRLDPAGFAG